jgi:hypothetical protein
VPSPTVTGPIPVNAPPGDPSHDYVYFTPEFELADYGYVEEEFFIEGTASRYQTTPAGQTGTAISSGHAYRTRIVVRRPLSRRRFNGTVLLEWQNVSAGYELDAHWAPSWEHIVEQGYAWVGVSAQRVGVHGNAAPAVNNGLKAWSPVRYGMLDVTDSGAVMDDSLSYDIFSQAAQAIRQPTGVRPLGNLRPQLIFAVGASQSAGRLSVYHNAIHPLHEVVDAFYLLVGGAGLRTDLDVKVFQYLSETDVSPARRMADSDHFRSWEVAGSAHSSYASDVYRTPLVLRDFGQQQWPPDCTLPPYSRVRGYHVINRQYDLLVRWVKYGIAPPTAPKIEYTTGEAPTIVRDELGIARGGIRLPEVEVPTALNTGVNSGATFCVLYGTYQPFDAATLQTLYPSHRAYVREAAGVAWDAARDGYVSPAAAWEMTWAAALEDVPPESAPAPAPAPAPAR